MCLVSATTTLRTLTRNLALFGAGTVDTVRLTCVPSLYRNVTANFTFCAVLVRRLRRVRLQSLKAIFFRGFYPIRAEFQL
jgi:hypothetical protein